MVLSCPHPLPEALGIRTGLRTLTDVCSRRSTTPEIAELRICWFRTQTEVEQDWWASGSPSRDAEGDRASIGPPAAPMAVAIAPSGLALQVQGDWNGSMPKAVRRPCRLRWHRRVDARDERRALDRGAHIVVGTPGRLRESHTRGRARPEATSAPSCWTRRTRCSTLGFREYLDCSCSARRPLRAPHADVLGHRAVRHRRACQAVPARRGGASPPWRAAPARDIAYQAVQVAAHDAETRSINLLLPLPCTPTAIRLRQHAAPTSRGWPPAFGQPGLYGRQPVGRVEPGRTHPCPAAIADGDGAPRLRGDRRGRTGIACPTDRGDPRRPAHQHRGAAATARAAPRRAGRKGISAMIVPDKDDGQGLAPC